MWVPALERRVEVRPRATAHALPQLEATQAAREPVRGTANTDPYQTQYIVVVFLLL